MKFYLQALLAAPIFPYCACSVAENESPGVVWIGKRFGCVKLHVYLGCSINPDNRKGWICYWMELN